MSRTAEVLGVERSNLYRKMRAFGIAPARRAGRGGRGGVEVENVRTGEFSLSSRLSQPAFQDLVLA